MWPWLAAYAVASLGLAVGLGKWLKRLSRRYPSPPAGYDDPLERLRREGDPNE